MVEDNQENTVLPVSNSYEELREMLGLPPVMSDDANITGKEAALAADLIRMREEQERFKN